VDEKAKASNADKPPEIDLKRFVSSLRQAGFPGAGNGKAQLKDALSKLQQNERLPVTGRIDQATADALVRRGVLTAAQARDLAPVSAQLLTAEAARTPLEPREQVRALRDQASSEPTTRGLPPQTSGDDAARVGRDGGAGEAVQAGEGGAQGSRTAGEGRGGIEGGDSPDGELSPGNAPSGDDRVDDERRGHAAVDDGSDHAEGHYQVPPLVEQLARALAALARDDGGVGAATYAWDVTLYRPGVYAAKQSAERLFHVVVKQASAFDPLWDEARAAINNKLASYEPNARPLTDKQLRNALRRARVRS
jgi:hypothetical protein